MIKINGELFANETFKNNEVVYKTVILSQVCNTIEMIFEGNKDITDLIFAVKYIRKTTPDAEIELNMPYIPYSRMDREINDQIFSLEIFAELINAMDFSIVRVYDPHSIVSEQLIKNLHIMPLEENILDLCEYKNIDVIMFPDKGARAKYTARYKTLCEKYPVIFAEKVRDLNNKGRILESKLVGDEDINLEGKNVLIVDDICVYGNTFKFASMALKKKGVNNVYLWVTHCEDVIYDGPLFTEGHIDEVFTTNSIVRREHEGNVTTIVTLYK